MPDETADERRRRIDALIESTSRLETQMRHEGEGARSSRLCVCLHDPADEDDVYYAGWDDEGKPCMARETELSPAQQVHQGQTEFTPIAVEELARSQPRPYEYVTLFDVFKGVRETKAEDDAIVLNVRDSNGSVVMARCTERALLASLPQSATATERVPTSQTGLSAPNDAILFTCVVDTIPARGQKPQRAILLFSPTHDSCGDSNRDSYAEFLRDLIEGLVRRDIAKGERGYGYAEDVHETIKHEAMGDAMIARTLDRGLQADPVRAAASAVSSVQQRLIAFGGGDPTLEPDDVVALGRSGLLPKIASASLEELVACVGKMRERATDSH